MISKKPKNALKNSDQRYDLATWNWHVANRKDALMVTNL